MQQEEILNLFKSEALNLDKSYHRQEDVVLLLARLVANHSNSLSQEDLDGFIHIGGTLYKDGASQTRARAEVAVTMQESHDAQYKKP